MTTDEIMILAAAWSAAIATRSDATPPQDELRAAITALVAERNAKADQIVKLLVEIEAFGKALTKAEDERDALRVDAERYRWLRDWLAFEGLLWCHFCKPPDAPIGNYWVLRKPAMVNGSSCEGYGKSEEEAIDAARSKT